MLWLTLGLIPRRPILSLVAAPAFAADTVPTRDELLKLSKGYERLQELLTNWDRITTGACRGSTSDATQIVATNAAGCDYSPLKIQEYVGYKSINDPLFKAEKLMMRATPLLGPDANLDAYLDNVNAWAEKAQLSSLNAYTSSWGEANPNGGRSVQAAFLDDARADVEEAADILKSILVALDLPLQT